MTTESRDIVERLEERVSDFDGPLVSADTIMSGLSADLREAITTIKFLRKAAGAVTQGPGFAEIAKDLPRQEPSRGMQAGPYVGVFRGLNDT